MSILEPPSWLRFSCTDVRKHLPVDWHEQIAAVVVKHARDTVLTGGSETSLEAPGTEIKVRVVQGSPIYSELSWLADLYEGAFLNIASCFFDTELFKCNSVDDAINVNCIEGGGSRYELHKDTNPVTGLLFVDTLLQEQGGALLFEKHGESFRVQPRSGYFCCFDAREVPHTVEPLREETRRWSIPMNYYLDKHNSGRDASLNEYLSRQG